MLSTWLEHPHLDFFDLAHYVSDKVDLQDFYSYYPENVVNIDWNSGYSFVRSDKEGWGPYYQPPLHLVNVCGVGVMDPLKVEFPPNKMQIL